MKRTRRVRSHAQPWTPPPTVPALEGDEVHVWRVDVGSAYTRQDVLWSFLAGDERQKATDFLFDNPYGKPLLAGDSGICFCTSHSHGLVLLAFARGRDIGVDIERVRDDLERIAVCCFSPREIATLHSLRNDLREEAFFAGWTRKEALAKAEGKGLALPLGRFNVTLIPGEPAMLLDTKGDPLEPTKWILQEVTPDPGYVAALAVEGKGLWLSC